MKGAKFVVFGVAVWVALAAVSPAALTYNGGATEEGNFIATLNGAYLYESFEYAESNPAAYSLDSGSPTGLDLWDNTTLAPLVGGSQWTDSSPGQFNDFQVTDAGNTAFWIFGGSRNGAQATEGSRYLFVEAHNPGTAYVQQVNFRAFNLSGSGEADSFGVWISDYGDLVKNTRIQFSYDGNTWDTAVSSVSNGQVFFLGFNSDTPFSHVRIIQEISGSLGSDNQDGFGIDEVYVGRTSNFQPSVPEPATLAIWSILGAGGLGLAAARRRRQA